MAKQGRNKIVAAAYRLFLKNGYKGVSIKDIIAASQLSKGAIYHHFENKRAIYLAALEENFFNLLKHASKADEHLAFKARIQSRYLLVAQLFSLIEFGEKDTIEFPIRAYFIFQLESERDEKIREKTQEAMMNYRQDIIAIVELAIERGEIKVKLPATTIAHQIMILIEGTALHFSTIEKNCEAFLKEKYDTFIGAYIDLITGEIQE